MGGGLLGIVSGHSNHTLMLYTRTSFVFETDRLLGNQVSGLTDFHAADQRRGTAGNSRLVVCQNRWLSVHQERSQARLHPEFKFHPRGTRRATTPVSQSCGITSQARI